MPQLLARTLTAILTQIFHGIWITTGAILALSFFQHVCHFHVLR